LPMSKTTQIIVVYEVVYSSFSSSAPLAVFI
jgi:hypothetical protein